jgi:CRISPR type I-E-associated protein CasB/Cse2
MVESKEYPIDKLIKAITHWIDGESINPKARGILADLRHGLLKTTEYRAWPHILGINAYAFDNPTDKTIWLTVAYGMALLLDPKYQAYGNLGATLKEIAQGQGEEGLNTFAGRFRRLLACGRPEEVCRQLPSIFRAAKQRQVPIDFKKLYWDLFFWSKAEKKVKIKWAKAYWANVSES